MRRTACIFWPVTVLLRSVTFALALAGRLAAIGLGLILMMIGLILTITIIGGAVGIPILMFGFLLVRRGLF
jgi:hypothetical protein